MAFSTPILNGSLEPNPSESHLRRLRRHWMWTHICAIVLILGAVVVALDDDTGTDSSVTAVPASALGTFAGYQWIGQVRSVAAEWRVPKITVLDSSHSSTWIGVQSPAGGFVQVGITEDSDPRLDVLNGDSAVDQGFWSDPTVGFHPQPLDNHGISDQRVRANDLITASIARVSHGWRLRLHDARSSLNFDQTIPMATTNFNQSEWFQEDPTDTDTNEPLPYPSLGSIAFSHLTVNGHQPVLGLQNAAWMSLPHSDFGVTELQNDSFKVIPVNFNQSQAQFLSARAPYQDAARRFDNVEDSWGTHPPTSGAALKWLTPFARCDSREGH